MCLQILKDFSYLEVCKKNIKNTFLQERNKNQMQIDPYRETILHGRITNEDGLA